MIRQCFLAKTGIRFHTSLFRQVGLDPSTLYPEVKPRPKALYVSSLVLAAQMQEADMHTSTPPSSESAINRVDIQLSVSAMLAQLSSRSAQGTLTEEEEDLVDALSPIYDQLDIAPGWWTLEYIPLPQRYQLPDNTWVDTWT